jgi:adenylate cyclase
MPLEIERKFLVDGDAWRTQARSRVRYRQGYLAGSDRCSVRVRIGGDSAWLGLKARVVGPARQEFEYCIPVVEAEQILDSLCAEGAVEKVRHRVPFDAHEWEVDEFVGENAGLVLAEIELSHEDEQFVRPPWIGLEVTDDARYYSSSLAVCPWRRWSAAGRNAP